MTDIKNSSHDQTSMITKVAWGISPPAPKYIAWGARAIYEDNCQIDLLWDRQEMLGGTDAERQQFNSWLNQWGLPNLRNKVLSARLRPGEGIQIDYQSYDWVIIANPQRSYGYLYIGAFPVDGVQMPKPHPAPPASKKVKPKARTLKRKAIY